MQEYLETVGLRSATLALAVIYPSRIMEFQPLWQPGLGNRPRPLLWTLVIWTIGLCLTQGEVIHRPSLGVVFESYKKLSNGRSFWKYTFSLDHIKNPAVLPDFDLCHHNAPHIATGRRRRGLVFAASICDDFQTLHGTYKELNRTLHESIRTYWRAARKLSHELHHSHRQRRSLFDLGGSVLSFSFGLVTKNQQEKLVKRIQILEHNSTARHRTFTEHKEQMITTLKLVNNRADLMSDAIKTNADAINNLTDSTNSVFRKLREVVVDTETSKLLIQNLADLSQASFSSIHHLLALKLIEDSARTRLEAMKSLAENKLSPLLIDPDTLFRAMRSVAKRLRLLYPEFQLLHDDPAFLYQIPSVVAASTDARLYVDVPIPLAVKSSIYQLFEINSFSIPTSEKSPLQLTRVKGHKKYFGISDNMDYHLALSQEEINDCFGNSILYCQRTFLEKPVDQPSCELALFKNSLDLINQYCEIDYIIVDEPVKSIYDLKNSSFLISGYTQEWTSTCGAGTSPLKIPSCSHCIITVPCACALRNLDGSYIPPTLSGCKFGKEKPTIVQSYTLNLLYYQNFYNQSVLQELMSHTLLDRPVELDVPVIHIETLDTDSYVRKDKAIVASLNKTIKTYKEKATPYIDQYTSWILSQGFLTTYSKFSFHVSIGSSIVALISMLWTCILARRFHNVQRMILLLQLAHVVKALDEEADTLPIIQMPKSINLSNTVSLTAVVLALLLWIIRKVRAAYLGRHSLSSFMRAFDKRPLAPRTRVLLELFSGHSRILLELAKICTPPGSVEIKVGNGPPAVEYMDGCITAHLVLTWDGTEVYDRMRRLSFQLPTVVTVPLHLKFLTKTVLASRFIANLLVGDDGHFEMQRLPTTLTDQDLHTDRPNMPSDDIEAGREIMSMDNLNDNRINTLNSAKSTPNLVRDPRMELPRHITWHDSEVVTEKTTVL